MRCLQAGGGKQHLDSQTISLITVPFFTGAIGYVTNWSGVWMLFYPVRFRGFRLPGLAPLANVLPRRVQQIPGVMQGGVGWQGIIPSRAAKMGSIAVDKGIAKLGSTSDFYKQLDQERIVEHVLVNIRGDIRDIVERTMQREHPRLWNDLPPRFREAVHERVQQQLPTVVREVMEDVGDNIEQLLDVKLMVIRRMEEQPELCNRVFLEVGKKEFRFIINFGFFFGFAIGIPTAVLTEVVFHAWWLLPICGVLIGWVTNWLALWMIYEPIEPRKLFGRFTAHGLFIRRQPEVAGVYAGIIADDIITVQNMGAELLNGPRSDRTRYLIEEALKPAVDRAVGPMQPAVRVAMGTEEYDTIRDTVATEGVEYTMTPLTDEDFNSEQAERVRDLIHERMLELPHADFSEMLRSVTKQDEWLLLLHGAVLGLVGGLLHLMLFG
jgi:uncharacterized membrane protein YheB (UPF0754 family)